MEYIINSNDETPNGGAKYKFMRSIKLSMLRREYEV